MTKLKRMMTKNWMKMSLELKLTKKREGESGSDESDIDIEWNTHLHYLLIILYWHGLVYDLLYIVFNNKNK